MNVDRGERGLLGIAFDPNFASNRFLYLYYTVSSTPRHNRVSRFTANGDVVVTGSETDPRAGEAFVATNHNGGAIHFGPDGKLYVAVGENGPFERAKLVNRSGKILRINPMAPFRPTTRFTPLRAATIVRSGRWACAILSPSRSTGHGSSFHQRRRAGAREEINDGIAGANYGWPNPKAPTTIPRFVRRCLLMSTAFDATTGWASGRSLLQPAIHSVSAKIWGNISSPTCAATGCEFRRATGTACGFATNVPSPVIESRRGRQSLLPRARLGRHVGGSFHQSDANLRSEF